MASRPVSANDIAILTRYLPALSAKYVVDQSTGCWVWNAALDRDGYGAITVARRKYRAHRALWIVANCSDVPEQTLDHICRNRACVNPNHLEPTSHKTNTLRGNALTAINARKTRCVQGHELTPDNVKPSGIKRSRRNCLECDRTYKRESTQRISVAARIVSMTNKEYIARYGSSRYTADQIIGSG